MKRSKLIILSILTICMYSCSNDSENDLIDIDDPDVTVVNYNDAIKSIMQSSCVGCHANPPVNGAPFALTNFSEVSQRANGIFSRMSLQNGAAGAMPPSGRLPQSTIDLVGQWIDDGKPEN